MTDRQGTDHDVLNGVAWIGPAPRPIGVPVIPLSGPGRGALLRDAVTIRRAGVEIALVSAQSGRLRDVAMGCTLGGVAGVVGFFDHGPAGPDPDGARNLPWWQRRIHRFACADAESAREWGRAGIALGRIVVIPPGAHEREALAAIVREVRSMGR